MGSMRMIVRYCLGRLGSLIVDAYRRVRQSSFTPTDLAESKVAAMESS